MKIKQLSIFLQNRMGSLSKPLEVLTDADVNIRAMCMADTSEFGILRLVVDDPLKGKEVLEEKQMNQEELANRVGRKREEITMFEKGSRTIDIYTLKDIAQVFNVSTDYLLGLTNFESAETENRSINELTGLSDEAIINLININKYHNGNILTIINT